MGTILADQLLARASTLLFDLAKRQWPETELLRWANDGQLAIVQARPDAYVVKRVHVLVAGTRQALLPDELALIDLSRNLGTDGATPGRAVTYVDRKQLDKSDPNWHVSTPNVVVRHWAYDRANPKTFWVWPPQPEITEVQPAARLEKDVGTVPPPLTIEDVDGGTETNAIGLDDTWLGGILSFMVYRAFYKESEHGDTTKADVAYREFMGTLGIATKSAQQFLVSKNQPPRYQEPPRTPNQGAFGEG